MSSWGESESGRRAYVGYCCACNNQHCSGGFPVCVLPRRSSDRGTVRTERQPGASQRASVGVPMGTARAPTPARAPNVAHKATHRPLYDGASRQSAKALRGPDGYDAPGDAQHRVDGGSGSRALTRAEAQARAAPLGDLDADSRGYELRASCRGSARARPFHRSCEPSLKRAHCGYWVCTRCNRRRREETRVTHAHARRVPDPVPVPHTAHSHDGVDAEHRSAVRGLARTRRVRR